MGGGEGGGHLLHLNFPHCLSLFARSLESPSSPALLWARALQPQSHELMNFCHLRQFVVLCYGSP